MIDIQFLRTHPDRVKRAILEKNLPLDIDRLIAVDQEYRMLSKIVEEFHRDRNRSSKAISTMVGSEREEAISKMKIEKERGRELEIKLAQCEREWHTLMAYTPNIPADDTPIDPNGIKKQCVRAWGAAPVFSFPARDHITLGRILDIIDVDRGVQTSGFRGYYLKNEGVLLQMGLMMEGLERMRREGFELMIPPSIVREFALFGSGHFPFGREEIYQIANPGKLEDGSSVNEPAYLAGTSEPSLLAYWSNQTINEQQFPIKMCGFSQCYRSEIGNYGKDTHGLYRIHEFMKVEQVVILPANLALSEEWFLRMAKFATDFLEALELPHRVMQLSTGDMGAGKYRMWDIETWMPSRNDYGETHSNSLLTDWQARRLNIRYKDQSGRPQYAYTLNNTVVASPRILIALLENHQLEDGSIHVPPILERWVGAKTIPPRKEFSACEISNQRTGD